MAIKPYKNSIHKKGIPGVKKRNFILAIFNAWVKIEPWEPWIIASLYFICMTYLTFRYHRIGYFGVETDFYAELVPQAKKLLSGHFSPLNYGPKGPVYSFLLAGTYIIIHEYFYAGLIINLISSFIFLVTLYFLIKNIFNRTTAVIVIFAVIFNFSFMNYTYQAGSDLPFMAVCALSMYFLFKNRRTRNLVLSSLFGLIAFLTRYNGAFIAMGAFFYLLLTGDSFRKSIKSLGLWIAIFTFIGLLWFIPNYLSTGNPVHNDNYINVMLEFYGKSAGSSYENWTDSLPKNFTGLGEIIMYDPPYFIKHLGTNVAHHFFSDMKKLIGWRLGIFVMLGFFMMFIIKPDKRKLIFFSFGIFYFLILTLVFYNERFSLYLLTMYFPLAIYPYTEKKLISPLKKFSVVPVTIIILVIASYSFTSTNKALSEIKKQPAVLKELKAMGTALGEIELDKSHKIIGRKPHVAHYAGLNPSMFPEDVRTVDNLVTFCRQHGIKYILYSGVEYKFRPYLRILLKPGFEHPGLEKVLRGKAGIIIRVKGI
ncbi:MAG TPA: glycosyltransferase family 39 protein [bacterium]|nr:glycosyltransferase family 39 protein [bacterium]